MKNEAFYAAASRVEITLPAGLQMDGYAARTCTSAGTHDPLLGQVLILKAADRAGALVTLDVLAVSAAWCDTLRSELASVLNTSPAAILVCASHTHCGPRGLQNWFGDGPTLDDTLIETIQSRLLEATREANQRLIPVNLKITSGLVSGIAGDRNQPDRQIDPLLTVLSLHDLDDSPVAILFHFPCHPTILGPDTCLYSADYPGAARRRIEIVFPGAVAFYLNGAAGNLSTRFTRREQSFAEVERMGTLLGEQVIDLLKRAEPIQEPPALDWSSEQLTFDFRSFSQPTPITAQGTDRLSQSKAEGAALESRLAQTLQGRINQPAEVCTLRVGGWSLMGVPGEAFDMLAHAAPPKTLIVGYANDYLGYFPTQGAIDAGTYEALSSPYDARAHAQLLQLVTSQSR